MAIKVSVISNPKNRISINKQDRTAVRVTSSETTNRVSINKQDRTTVRAVGIPSSSANVAIGIAVNASNTANLALSQSNVALSQSNVALDIAISSYDYANTLVLSSPSQLVNLTDVDATSVDNNETLVYDQNSGKFVIKELPIINGGTF